MENNRTTFLIGAGTPLDLDLPQGVIKASTSNITDDVRKPYTNHLIQGKTINIVDDIYNQLMCTYPPDYSNPYISGTPTPYIHFEHLFHILEMLDAYSWVWIRNSKNPNLYPVFAPFIQPNISFDADTLHSVMDQFILRIMDIVNGYDSNIMKEQANEWYWEFYQRFAENSDFFVLNYDTTIEKAIGTYEDGFEPDGIQNVFLRFNPKKLFENPNGLSTINHLHGCINYYFQSYKDLNKDIYTFLFHDLYKYPDYATVKGLMIGRGQSQPCTQSGETYYSSPIVTGLRKTDKLNCVPFDFYHANMTNCIIRNHKLVIAGYSFGDLYCNNLLERMNFLHGNQKRIVLIDFWDIPKGDRIHGGYWLSQNQGKFLCRMTNCVDFDGVIHQLYKNENSQTGALYSDNGCLMVLPKGFKHAATCSNEIVAFLNS